MEYIVGILLLLGVIFFAILNIFVPFRLWIAARAAGVKVRIFRDLVAMRLRRVPQANVINPLITSTKGGLAAGPCRSGGALFGGRKC